MRAQEFLAQRADVEQPDHIIANKIKFQRDEALALAKETGSIWAARGKSLKRFETGVDDDEAIGKAILGPSGTLRAPAIRVNGVFMVGFNADAYGELFPS